LALHVCDRARSRCAHVYRVVKKLGAACLRPRAVEVCARLPGREEVGLCPRQDLLDGRRDSGRRRSDERIDVSTALFAARHANLQELLAEAA
jgi:hypothetical protein